MIRVLEEAIAKVKALPAERQAYAAEVLEHIAAAGTAPFTVPQAHRQAVLAGVAEAERGDLVSEMDMAALWTKIGV